MKKLKNYAKDVQSYFLKHPKAVIVVSFTLFFVILGSIEYVRAHYYLKQVDEFKHSLEVLSLTDRVERLSRAVEGQSNSLYCNLSTDLLVEVKLSSDEETKTPQSLNREVRVFAQESSPAPGFNSLAQFVPKVRKARQTSVDITQALSDIKNLTREDDRSVYCSQLVNSLIEVYYVSTLSTPQGVGALHVAQQENFKQNVNLAQDSLMELIPPDEFVSEHVQINDYLNNLRLDLTGDTTSPEQFSRSIERDTEVLESIFSELAKKSADLSTRADYLLLNAQLLK